MTSTISQTEKSIDESKRTAIIYSVNDTGHYMVEIRYANEHYFIEKNHEPEIYLSIETARQAASKHKAEKALLALPKTYQEVEAEREINSMEEKANAPRYDYVPIAL